MKTARTTHGPSEGLAACFEASSTVRPVARRRALAARLARDLALHSELVERDLVDELPIPLALEIVDLGARIIETARTLGLTERAAGAPVRASTKTKARPAAAAKTARSSTEAHVLGWPDPPTTRAREAAPPTPGAITRTETKGGATRAGKR